MLRRLLIVAFCALVAIAPLADSLCFRGCDDGRVSETHHSCAMHPDNSTAIKAVPHRCANSDGTLLRSVEVRPTAAVAALPPSTRFDPPLPIVGVVVDPRSRVTPFSIGLLTPLRI